MFCPKCGNEVADGVRFCSKCGTNLQLENGVDENGVELSSRNSDIAAVLSIFFGILGVHDFYCGNILSGVVKIIFSCTILLSIVSVVLNILDLVSIGNGTYMDNDNLSLRAAPWAKIVAIVQIVFTCIALCILILCLV